MLGFDFEQPLAEPTPVARSAWKLEGSVAPCSSALDLLRQDLTHLDSTRLSEHLPRTRHQRLVLGSRVLLASYEAQSRDSRGRPHPIWLVADLPGRRAGPQLVTMRLLCFRGDREPHRWDAERWRWDGRIDPTLPGIDIARIERILATTGSSPSTALEDDLESRIARCLLLQETSNFLEALAIFGMELTPPLRDALAGGPATMNPKWSEAVRSVLRTCSPWRFESTLARTTQVRGDRSNGKGTQRGSILVLPGQRQARRARIILRRREDGVSVLDFAVAGLEIPVIAESDWRRPRELDALVEKHGHLDRRI
ncbi:MAG: hypothetical protein ACAI25_12790 [Planctomycetota bacterium]